MGPQDPMQASTLAHYGRFSRYLPYENGKASSRLVDRGEASFIEKSNILGKRCRVVKMVRKTEYDSVIL